MALPDFPVPPILFFTSGNPYTGSHKGMNYRIIPIKGNVEKNITAHFEVAVWDGLLCSDLATMRAEATFPLDTDGLEALKAWVRQQYEEAPV